MKITTLIFIEKKSKKRSENYYLFSLTVADLLILLLGNRKLRFALFIYPYVLLMKITTFIFIEKKIIDAFGNNLLFVLIGCGRSLDSFAW